MKYLISTNDISLLQEKDYGRVVLELTGDKDVYFKGFKSTAVDLGLPSGLLWATTNVGATSPTDSGLYFAWGDTQGYSAEQVGTDENQKQFKSDFTDYVYSDGATEWDNPQFTKYCNNKNYGKDKDFTDEYTKLEAEDDMVSNNTSLKWRMPLKKDFYELLKNCIPTLLYQDGTEDVVDIDSIEDESADYYYCFGWSEPSKYKKGANEVVGMKLTSRVNGNAVFFPASGYAFGGQVQSVGFGGNFWSASLNEGSCHDAWRFYFDPDAADAGSNVDRSLGFPVRGVCGAGAGSE